MKDGLMELVYAIQEHRQKRDEKSKKRVELCNEIHHHTAQIIRLQRELEEKVLELGLPAKTRK